jgi:hypothetical protein
MALIVFFDDIQNCPTELYYETLRRLDKAGAHPPRGQLFHVMYVEDGEPHVINVFDTQENFEAFGAVLGPILADLGIEVGPPTMKTLENYVAG